MRQMRQFVLRNLATNAHINVLPSCYLLQTRTNFIIQFLRLDKDRHLSIIELPQSAARSLKFQPSESNQIYRSRRKLNQWNSRRRRGQLACVHANVHACGRASPLIAKPFHFGGENNSGPIHFSVYWCPKCTRHFEIIIGKMAPNLQPSIANGLALN